MAEGTKWDFFKVLGAVGVIVTILVGLKNLYEFFSAKNNVSVTGEYNYYQTSPDYFNYDSVQSVLAKQYTESHIPPEQIEEMFDYRSLYKFYIKNDGDAELEDIRVETGFRGIFKVVSTDSITRGEFDKTIFAGNLRPSYDLTVYCWVKGALYRPSLDRVRVTHKRGFLKVNYENLNYYNLNTSTSWSVLFPAFVFSILGISIFFLIRHFFRKKSKSV